MRIFIQTKRLVVFFMLLTFMFSIKSLHSQVVWDGTTVDQSWYNATDTVFDISTAEELAGLAALVNAGNNFSGKTINLTTDIYLNENDYDVADANNWIPIGQSDQDEGGCPGGTGSNRFSGIFNGNNFSIYNMYISASTTGQGLFGGLYGATLTRFNLINPVMVTPGMSGCVAAATYGGTINISKVMVINASMNPTCNNAGFFIGATYPGGTIYFRDCCATGTATISTNCGYFGSFCGNGNNASLYNCYSYWSHSGNPSCQIGGILAYSNNNNQYNCYSNVDGGTAGSRKNGVQKTEAEMLDASFITLLGDAIYKADCGWNNGLPILSDILCGVPVTGITDICSGQSTTLIAAGWDSYQWSHGLGYNETVTVSPTTTTDYYVTGTTGSSSKVDTVTVYVSQNIQITPSIALSPDGAIHGSITASAYSQSCTSNSPITISITAESGYYITKIIVNGTAVETFDVNEVLTHVYTISNPQETSIWDVVVHLDNKYTVTTTKVLNDEGETLLTETGLVTPNEGNIVVRGLDDTTVYFHETSRYHIQEVFIDGIPHGIIDSIELVRIVADVDIKVVYSDDCGIVELPYSDDFESNRDVGSNAAFPECYGRLNTYSTASSYPSISASFTHSGDRSVYFYAGGTTYNILTLPIINVEGVEMTDLRVKFWARTSNIDVGIQVGVMTDPTDSATFTSCYQTSFPKTDTYTLFKVDLSDYEGDGKYIAFRYSPSAYYGIYLDDINVDRIPTCEEVENLTVSHIAGSSALISWSESISEELGYNLEWRIAGEEDWNPEYTIDNYFQLEGLEGLTNYEVRVNADCGTISTWENINFMTLCDNSPIQIGNRDDKTYYYPISYYNSYSQQLYMREEISETPMSIQAIQLQYYNAAPITRNVDIYMGHTQKRTFASASEFIHFDSLRLVFSGKVEFNNRGAENWMMIVLDSTFEYNGVGNLVLAIDDNGEGATSAGTHTRFYNHSATERKTIAFYQINSSGANIDPASPMGTGIGSVLPFSRNNIKFLDCNVPNCIKPNAFRILGVGASTIDIGWIPANTTEEYELEYKRSSVATWQQEGFVQGDAYQLSDLNSNTLYDIRLRSSCSGGSDTSAWVVISARTACDLVVESELPFEEGFDDYQANEYPVCWSRMTTGTNLPYIHRTAVDVHSSPSAMDFHYSPNCANVAVLPEFDMNITELQMDFWVKSKTDVGRLLVGVMEDKDDYTTFVCVDTVKTQAHQKFEEYSVRFDNYEGSGRFIAFAWTNGTNTSYSVDDIYVNKIPFCSRPDAMSVDSVKSNTAYISWTELGTPDQYLVEVGAPGFAYGEGEALQTFTTVDNPLEITGLSPNTKYDVYIQADCGDVGLSFVASRTFTTSCTEAIILEDLPYTEKFDSYGTGSPIFPTCWTRMSQASTTNPSISSLFSISAPASLYFSGSTNEYVSAATEKFDMPVNTLQLEFSFRSGNKNVPLIIGAVTNPANPATFDTIALIYASTANTWESRTVYLNTYQGTGQYIAFKTSGIIYLDNVEVDLLPTCIPAQDISVDVTANTAEVSWTSDENATDFTIEYHTADFTPGKDAEGVIQVTGATSPETLTNLSGNTKYYGYILSDCSGETSTWKAFTFRTACGAIQLTDLPYNEDFDDYGTGPSSFPICWTKSSTYSATYPYINTIDTISALYFYASATTHATAATEQFDLPVDKLQVEFKFRTNNIANGLTVGVMTDPANDTTFTPVQTVFNVSTTEWRTHTVYLNNYTGNGKHIAFRMSAPISMYLDDLEIDLAPTCIPVQNLAVFNQTTSSAEFVWMGPGNAVSYEIEVGLPGFTPGDGTADIVDDVTDEFYSITSGTLSEATAYVFAIRSVCEGDDGESAWTLLNFSTTANETYGDGIWHGYVYKSPIPDVPANRFGTYLGMVFEQPVFDRNPDGLWTGDSSAWIGDAPGEYFAVRYKMTYDFPCDYYTFTFTGINDAVRFSTDGGQTWMNLCRGSNCGEAYGWHTTSYDNGTYTGKAHMNGSADLVLEYFNAAGGKRCAFSYAPASIGVTTSNLTANSADVNFGDGDEWDVIVSTSVQTDLTNPTNVVENTINITSNPYTISNLTPETTYYIYAKLACGTIWCNTSVKTLPSCPAVTDIYTAAVTASSVDFAWTAGGSESEWSVKIVPAGVDHSTYTGTPVQSASYTTTTLSDGTSLGSNTSYDCWVQAICGVDDNSAWVKHIFKTDCGAGNIADMGYSEGAGSIPWVEDFNYGTANLVSELPACWTNVLSSLADNNRGIYVHTSDKRLDFGGGPITSGFRAAIMPELPVEVDVTQLKMKFKYGRNGGGTYVKICMTDNPGSISINDYELIGQTTTTEASPILSTNSISFEEYTGTARYIAFVVEDGGGIIDNLRIWIDTTVSVTCAAPTGLSASAVTVNSANISWNASATAVTYTLEYKKSTDENYNTPITGITATSYPLTDLEAGTQYNVRVKSVCTGGNESAYTPVFNFILPAETTTYTIEASAGPNGSINPSGSVTVDEGA
ncbi:fibronectin type III domain-containing protein, partial [Bacteroidales bacterium OttesenSCG-928-E04]|nr:fibronectin type III domain-containing protein [Bacteroidales bacterium OttesenSCG-928-E04]